MRQALPLRRRFPRVGSRGGLHVPQGKSGDAPHRIGLRLSLVRLRDLTPRRAHGSAEGESVATSTLSGPRWRRPSSPKPMSDDSAIVYRREIRQVANGVALKEISESDGEVARAVSVIASCAPAFGRP